MNFDLGLALTCPQWLDVYANDVVIRRFLRFPNKTKGGKGTRNCITELTKKALGRLAFFASNCTVNFKVFITASC